MPTQGPLTEDVLNQKAVRDAYCWGLCLSDAHILQNAKGGRKEVNELSVFAPFCLPLIFKIEHCLKRRLISWEVAAKTEGSHWEVFMSCCHHIGITLSCLNFINMNCTQRMCVLNACPCVSEWASVISFYCTPDGLMIC